MLIETLASDWRKVRGTNATDNGFPSRIPQATEPSGIGDDAAQASASAVYECSGAGNGQNALSLKAFGAGSNNNTFSLKVIGWSRVHAGTLSQLVWDPTVLVELLCTLSSSVTGIAGGIVTTTDLFADTMSIVGTTANAGVSVNINSPANDTAAFAVVNFYGFQKFEVTFTTGASATNCNALWRLL